MAYKVTRIEEEIKMLERIIILNVVEFTCDICGKIAEARFQGLVSSEVTPVSWKSVYTGEQGRKLLCDTCLVIRQEQHDSPEYKKAMKFLNDLLDLFWYDDRDRTGHTTPFEYDDVLVLRDKVLQMVDEYEEDK